MNEPAARVDDSLGTVELRIPCKAEWVAVARLAVAAVANRLSFSIEEIEDVKLAVAEACTNCIQHARGTGQIKIVCDTQNDSLTVRVRDFTETAREPFGGLGVFLIRSLMDRVEYDVRPEGGSDLVMTKNVAG